MTRSAPSERARSTFRVLHTAVTSAPNAFAIWTANVPTPPEAPLISTFCPAWSSPLSRSPWRAVIAAIGTAAACSNVMFAGFGAIAFFTETYSANAPVLPPKTSSPGLKSVRLAPTASTIPAKSAPTLGSFGLRQPICGRPTRRPFVPYHSAGFTEDARTRTSTSSSAGTGLSMSTSSRTSGVPYSWQTIAFIVPARRSG